MSYPSLVRAVEGFLISLAASGKATNTISSYKLELVRFQNWIGDKSIDKITPKDIEAFILYLRNDYRITHVASTPITPRKISQKSISNAQATLAVFWRWASKELQIPNPFSIPPIKFHTKAIYPLSFDEVEKLLKACDGNTKPSKKGKTYFSRRPTCKRDKAIVLILLDSGIRVSELCNISFGDLDLEVGKVMVTGKGNKSRFIFLGRVCKQAIWQYAIERFPNEKPAKDEPLFVHNDGIHRLTRQGILLLLKRLGNKAQVNNVHPHKFRHTFAIQFLRNGGNVFELQQFLGHTTLDIVKKYVRLAQIDLEIVARKASPADNWKLR